MHLLLNSKAPMKNLLRMVLQVTVLSVTSLTVLTGCQASKGLINKVDNGSLNYLNAKQLEPLQLPADQATSEFIPLYPTPTVGTNTLELTNKSNQRYKLPKPYRQVP